MNNDRYHHSLGLFFNHMARISCALNGRGFYPDPLASNAAWAAAKPHIEKLMAAREHLLEVPNPPPMGFDPAQTGSALAAFDTNVVQALAYDAGEIAAIPMGLAARPQWYDPSAPDGLTPDFPDDRRVPD